MFSANSSQVSEDRLYVEDVFSTYLYTGNGGTQTITNGIDLAGKGGLVWVKARGDLSPLGLTGSHTLYDTNRGTSNALRTNGTFASASISGVTAFNSNGFGLDTNGVNNASGYTYASWTFREAPKFFDVVTYTGNGSAQNISHNLGVAPGFIVVKSIGSTSNWFAWHRNDGAAGNATTGFALNSTSSAGGTTQQQTATTFNTSQILDQTYATPTTNGATYVAYLFAHDASSDGIIQCGSYTGNGSSTGPTVNLGWEPQWLLVKGASGPAQWYLIDNMRGMALTGNGNSLYPNTSQSENQYWAANFININSTGFQVVNTDSEINASGSTYVYIAIRRGPMRTPTSGTSVFVPILQQTGTLTTGFPIDTQFARWTGGPYANNTTVNDRLRAFSSTTTANTTGALITSSTSAETIAINTLNWTNTTAGVPVQLDGTTGIYWNFRRAPSFFDVVCYTGTGSATTFNHNLGVAPELMLVKQRNSANDWPVYGAALPNANTNRLILNGTQAATANSNLLWNSTSPTSTVFSVGTSTAVNGSGSTYVAYLFASCPGVSKVGSYTGNGSSQTINCGFAAGARFVMIKRTDSTGDWYVWDTARGIVSGNDPRLSLNSTAAEVTTDDSVDTDSSGFVVNQLSATNINVSSATYIYLAVA